MLKEYFLDKVIASVKDLAGKQQLGQLAVQDNFALIAEVPKNTQFGDFAVNVSSLAKFAKLPPVKIAELIAENISKENFDINVTAGFINFKINNIFFK